MFTSKGELDSIKQKQMFLWQRKSLHIHTHTRRDTSGVCTCWKTPAEAAGSRERKPWVWQITGGTPKKLPLRVKDPGAARPVQQQLCKEFHSLPTPWHYSSKQYWLFFVMCWETLGTMIYGSTFLWIFIKWTAKYLSILERVGWE